MPQPFVNPNYFMQYPQYQQPMQTNPYLQRMENLQQFQQTLNQPQVATPMSLPNQTFAPLGKMVESMDIVKVTDIPMDGNVYYFPKADGSEIYSKQFLPTGQTHILTFKPILEDEANNLSSEQEKLNIDAFKSVLEGIQEDIRSISDKVDRLNKPTRAKKEVAENE